MELRIAVEAYGYKLALDAFSVADPKWDDHVARTLDKCKKQREAERAAKEQEAQDRVITAVLQQDADTRAACNKESAAREAQLTKRLADTEAAAAKRVADV